MLYTERMATRKKPVDLDQLEVELRAMHPRTRLYDIVKAEMVKRGRWKRRPGGLPFERGKDERRNDRQFK